MTQRVASPLKKVISGGQTGADQGALEGAKDAGLATGGTAPKGWRTESGPSQALLEGYGLVESISAFYRTRTWVNVVDSDGTLIFGNPHSSGSALTEKACKERNKPYTVVNWRRSGIAAATLEGVAWWIEAKGIRTLNVAGNRESGNPGIHKATRDFIVHLVTLLKREGIIDG